MNVRMGGPHSRYRGFPPWYHHVQAKFFSCDCLSTQEDLVQLFRVVRDSVIDVLLTHMSWNEAKLNFIQRCELVFLIP
jgi:hypothetical protein